MNAPDIQPVHEASKKVDEKRNKNNNLSDIAREADDEPLMILCRGAPSEEVPSMIIVACLFDLGLHLGTADSWYRKSCGPSPLKNDSYGGRVPIRIPRVELTGQ